MSIDNGVGIQPAMGYNTWNDYNCDRINEENVASVIHAFVRLNLSSFGYNYINLDDCWASHRDKTGTIVADKNKFPNGIKYLADLAHKNGLKFGIYTDRGRLTCAWKPGSYGYEQQDADTYASWGIDYVKEDSCFSFTVTHQEAFAEYEKMRDALNSTGRHILFSLCGWHNWYAPKGKFIGNSWRIARDVGSWDEALNTIDVNSHLSQYASPGSFNDADMLLGSKIGSNVVLSPQQSRTQFSMWAIMSSPLLLGTNVANMTTDEWDYETYTNHEIISVNQDKLGKQGCRISGGNMHGLCGDKINIWAKLLSDGSWGIIFINNNDYNVDIVCDKSCMEKMNLLGSFHVRDLWLHKNVGIFNSSNLFEAKNVEKNGGSKMYKFISLHRSKFNSLVANTF